MKNPENISKSKINNKFSKRLLIFFKYYKTKNGKISELKKLNVFRIYKKRDSDRFN